MPGPPNRYVGPDAKGSLFLAEVAGSLAFVLAINQQVRGFVYRTLIVWSPSDPSEVLWKSRWNEAAMVITIAVAATCLILLVWHLSRTRRKFLLLWCSPLLAFIALAFASLNWSWNESATYNAAWSFAALTLAIVYMGLNHEIDRVLRLFTTFAAVLLVVNLMVVILLPDLAVMTAGRYAGALRGIFNYKNSLGEAAALMNLVFLVGLAGFKNQGWGSRVFHALSYVLTLWLAWRSDSATSALLVVVNLGVLAGALLLAKWGDRLKSAHVLGISGVGLLGLALAWQARHFIVLDVLGRKYTLTGRIPLWLHLIPFIKQRLWLGYGFGRAFWAHPDNARKIHELVGWFPASAHNGYIDIVLSLGIVGLFLFGLIFLQTLISALRLIVSSRTVISAFPLMLFCYAVAANMAYSRFVVGLSLAWLAMISAWAMGARSMMAVPREVRAAPEAGRDGETVPPAQAGGLP